MLDIKCFKDGKRLVVTIDGLENIDSAETTVCNFIKTLMPADANPSVSDGNAAPVVVPEEVPKYIAYIGIQPYADKTADEILFSDDSKANTEAFNWFCETLQHTMFDKTREDIFFESLTKYLKNRFCQVTDTKAYADKLSIKQTINFMKQYPAFNNTIKKEIKEEYNISFENYKTIDENNIGTFKKIVELVLNCLLNP